MASTDPAAMLRMPELRDMVTRVGKSTPMARPAQYPRKKPSRHRANTAAMTRASVGVMSRRKGAQPVALASTSTSMVSLA